MDDRPIGVFDSGLGGLTTVRELCRLLPEEDIVYFGDTGRVPYGSRSRETIVKYARQDVAFLRTFDLKTIVIACGTVSTTALDVLAAENPIPVLGVVAPAARAAARATRSGSIGLIGTQASIRSGAYERLIRAENPAARVLAQPCPLFVPLVENGRFRPGDVVIETVAAEYLAPLKEAGVDTLVLGCTHYPLLEKVIGAYMGPEVRLINSGAEGARAAADCLRERDALAGPGRGSCRCLLGGIALDDRPIGVFDSGLGGLTTVRELCRLLPEEDIVYFGDTGRVPYGSRSRETIVKYARQDVAFLRTFDLKTIVIACGTVSTTALDVLAAENPIPVLGVVAPAARAAARATRSGSIGLIGTQASIRSGAYERLIRAENPAARVLAQPCPLFVPLVENGRFRPGDVVIETVAAEYLAPLKEAGVDTLVLGCTHYPLLEKVIGAYMGPEVRLINSGAEGARAAADCLRERDALAGPGRGSCRCFVSDRQEDFSRLASTFLGWDVAQAVEQVDISQY